MDSIKSFKGYGKVDGAEDREFKRKARRRLILIVISAIVLVAIVIGIVIAVVANKGGGDDDGPEHDNSPSSISNSIKAMCSVTRYPDSCFTSISSVTGSNLTSDPEELFRLSLQVASDALSKLASLPGTVTVMSNDKRLKAVIKDCKDLFDDAVEQLQDSVSSMRPTDPNKKLLTESKINDLKTWLSAAITNQETCLDGFEGTTGDLHDKFEAAMANATQFTSNSLAIAARIHGILKDLNFQLHRKLLGTRGTGQFPEWISGSQRRALLQAPSELGSNVTVAQDGTGQVKTIKEAIAMAAHKSLSPFVIYVKAGVYEENVVIEKSKWNVHIYGDGMYKTIVSGSLNFVDGTPTFSTATFAVVGKGFMARDMGFKNTAGPEKHQAVAFRSGSDQSVYYRCAFDAYQDTLYAHAMRQFYRECDITGTVDFIFGDAAVVFQKCTIRPRQPLPNQQNIITAQGKKDPNEDTGIVIQDCTITSSPDVTAPTYLGRPWKNYSTTIYLQSDIGAVVDQTGWLSWIPGTDPPKTINYGEFQNTGPGSNVAGRVKWAGYNPAVSAEDAAQYTVHAFLEGAEWIAQKGVTYDSTL